MPVNASDRQVNASECVCGGKFAARSDEFAAPLWAKSMAEVAGGTVKGPYTAKQVNDIFGSPESWRSM
eukprot:712805-Prymnesium_polylepis.1